MLKMVYKKLSSTFLCREVKHSNLPGDVVEVIIRVTVHAFYGLLSFALSGLLVGCRNSSGGLRRPAMRSFGPLGLIKRRVPRFYIGDNVRAGTGACPYLRKGICERLQIHRFAIMPFCGCTVSVSSVSIIFLPPVRLIWPSGSPVILKVTSQVTPSMRKRTPLRRSGLISSVSTIPFSFRSPTWMT